MNKTIKLTFAAAALLMAMAMATHIFGYHSDAAQRAAERMRRYCDHCETGLESWERASGLLGLLAVSVSIAGGILWDREMQPQALRRSVLGLDEIASRRAFRAAAPSKSVVAERVYVQGNRTHPMEEENLSPLERVIRGY